MSRPAPHWRGEWLAAGVALLALLAWDASGWDLALSRLYGSASGFAWRDAWLTRTLLHDGGRWLAGVALALQAGDAWRPLAHGPRRRERVWWLAVTVAAMLLVPALKRASLTSCPWDLAPFGGLAHHVSHWRFALADGGPGHCFPSGHAVAAFAFFGLYFLWRPHRPRAARAGLTATLALGLAFGWAQLARGAHFASHTLWSAWLCWFACCIAAAACERVCRPWRGSRWSSQGSLGLTPTAPPR